MSGVFAVRIQHYLSRLSRRNRTEGVLMLLLGVLLVAPSLYALSVLFFQIAGFYSAAVLLMRWVLVVVSFVFLAHFPWARFFAPFDPGRTASRADRFLGSDGRVEAAVSFLCRGVVSGSLEELHLRRTAEELRGVPGFAMLYPRLFLRIAASGFLLFIIQLLFAGSSFRLAGKMLFTGDDAIRLEYRLQYPRRLESGASFRVKIKTDAKAAWVEYGHDGDRYCVRAKSAGVGFFSSLKVVRRELFFRVGVQKYGREKAGAWRRVSVLQPLEAHSVRFTARYPAWMHRKAEVFADRTRLVLPRGSLVTVSGRSSAPLSACRLEGVRVVPVVEGRRFRAVLRINSSVVFRLRLRGADGRENKNPLTYRLIMMKNRPPAVSLLSPEDGLTLPRSLRLALVYDITDDTGIRQARLHYAVHHPDWKERGVLPLPFEAKGGVSRTVWDINRLPVSPGEKVSFHIRAADRAGLTGRSRTITVRLPSLRQMFRRADRAQGDLRTRLEKIIRRRKAAAERLAQLQRRKDNTGRLGGQEVRRELHRLKKERQRLNRELSKLAGDIRRQQDRLETGPSLSSETVRALQKLREALAKMRMEVKSGNLALPPKAARKLRLSPEKLKRLEKRIAEQAKRMLAALKRMERERVLDSVRNRLRSARRLLRKNGNVPGKKAIRQAAQLTKDASRQLGKLVKRGKAHPAVDRKLKKMADRLGDRGLAAKIRRLEIGRSGERRSGSRKIRAALKKMEDRLSRMTGQGRRQAAVRLLRELRALTGEVLFLADRYNGIVREYGRIGKNWLRGPGAARGRMMRLLTRLGEQSRLLGARFRRLRGLTAGISLLPPPPLVYMARVGQGVETIRSRIQNRKVYGLEGLLRKTGRNSELTVAALLKFTDRLQKALSGKCKGGGMPSSGSPGPGQKKLDREMRELLKRLGSGKLTPGQRKRLAEMAAMQRMIRKALARRYGGRFLGDLKALQRDMKRIEDALRKGRLNKEVYSRERRVLKRLLQGIRAMRRMGKRKRRRAERTGKDVPGDSGGLLPQRLMKVRKLMRSLGDVQRLTPQQKALVRRYLNLLYQEIRVSPLR